MIVLNSGTLVMHPKMDMAFSSVLLCFYTLITCLWLVFLIYWIGPDQLGVCA